MSRLIRSQVLASAARTTAGQQGLPAANDHGNYAVLIRVSAVSGTSPTTTFFLEDSEDGTNWFPIKNTSAITAVGNHRIALTPNDGPTTHRLRVRWTMGGTTPSFTFELRGISRPRMGG